MNQEMLIQSVPNFSEGRDLKKIEQIVDAFRARPGVKLLDYSTDPEFNRCVVTVVGQPGPLKDAMVNAIGRAVELIDMTNHVGQHPRLGCVDVIPFIPIRNCAIEDADYLARAVAKEAAERFGQPFYLYEKSATAPYRVDVADIRRGQFEGLHQKMQDPLWKPDFGPDTPHPTGGLRYVKAMGIAHEERRLAQVTMNLTDYTRSSMYSVFEMIKVEARRYGVNVLGSEIVGIVPVQALIDSAEYYLQIENLSPDQILENIL